MKKLVIPLLLLASVAASAQSYKMIINVNNGMEMGFPDNKISIPVDNIRDVSFEEISDDTIPSPDHDTPISFLFKDYISPSTRSRSKKSPALTNRRYGVFAYYKDNETDTIKVMHNQEVEFANGSWVYAPIKYWRRENVDYSFFAYSPYAGIGTSEFLHVNNNSEEPMLEYTSVNPMNDEGDLLYGSQLNTTRLINNGCVSIESKHALARFNFKAVAANELDSNTKMTIQSVKINGVPYKGSFNLYRQQWTNLSPDSHTYTIEGDNLMADIRDAGDISAANQPEGVTSNPKTITVSPSLFIPTDGVKDISFTIEYYVTTNDPALAQGFVRIPNVIAKNVSHSIQAGYSYDVKFILGFTSVKLEISSSSLWDDADTVISF